MSEYMVSKTAKCVDGGRCRPYPSNCSGCLGNGTRVLLDTATPVERTGQPLWDSTQAKYIDTLWRELPLGDSGDTDR